MHVIVVCPACRNEMLVPEEARGQRFRCPHCGGTPSAHPEVSPDARPAGDARAVSRQGVTLTPPPPSEAELLPVLEPVPGPATGIRRRGRGREVGLGRRPWYLFALAVLPLGLGLVGLSAHWLAGVDAGRALAVGLGVGGLLAALCLGVAVWRAPVSLRLTLSASVAGGSYVVGFAVVGLVLLLRPRGIDESAWKEFAPPGGRFTVLMPGKPIERPLVPGGAAVPPGKKYTVELNGGETAFVVAYVDFPGLTREDLNRCVKAEEEALCGRLGGRVASRGDATLGGRQAREFSITVPGKRGMAIERVCPVHHAGGCRVYIAAAAGPTIGPRGPDAEKFFRSFRLEDPSARPRTPPPEPRPTPQQNRRPPGLLAHWPLDQGNVDASGGGHHGTLHAAEWVDGVRGKALRLRGPGSYFDYGGSPDFNFAAGEPFTFAGWLRTTQAQGTVFSQRNSKAGSPVIDLLLIGGRLHADVRDDGNEFGSFAQPEFPRQINDGRWHHFALTRNGGNRVRLYADGELGAERSAPQAGGAITTDLRALGWERAWAPQGPAGQSSLKGDVDDFCVYNRELSAEEVKALAGRSPPPPR